VCYCSLTNSGFPNIHSNMKKKTPSIGPGSGISAQRMESQTPPIPTTGAVGVGGGSLSLGTALKGRKEKMRKEASVGSNLNALTIRAGTPMSIDSTGSNNLFGSRSGEFSSGTHPLSIGHLVLVAYRDGSKRTAKVIERVITASTIQYYVHYHDFNRRMDEWIDQARILSTEGIVVDDHHGHGGQKHEQEQSHDIGAVPAKRAKTDAGDNTEAGKMGGAGITTIAELGYDEHEGLDDASLLEHEEITKIKNINHVVLGKYRLECWYYSPFPKEFHPNGPVDCLYFCEFTLRFFKTKNELMRYQNHANLPRHPPGNEIYRDHRVAMFELDGAVEKVYCQNLCYFAKLFLDHKVRRLFV
jgi:hypothetical protein